MKFTFALIEEFRNKQKKDSHFSSHVGDGEDKFPISTYPNEDEYEQAADRLALTPVKTYDINSPDDVVGFVEDGIFGYNRQKQKYVYKKANQVTVIKYQKSTKSVVVYMMDNSTKSGVLILTFYQAEQGDKRYTRLLDHYKKNSMTGEVLNISDIPGLI